MAVLLAFTTLLKDKGYEVDTAETIEDAEQCLEANEYAVVIADLRPTGILGEEGLEIIKYVKENTDNTKCILVTGYGSPEIMEKAYGLGADFYFEKPVSSEVILKSLERLSV